jgi:hypothetical protein
MPHKGNFFLIIRRKTELQPILREIWVVVIDLLLCSLFSRYINVDRVLQLGEKHTLNLKDASHTQLALMLPRK